MIWQRPRSCTTGEQRLFRGKGKGKRHTTWKWRYWQQRAWQGLVQMKVTHGAGMHGMRAFEHTGVGWAFSSWSHLQKLSIAPHRQLCDCTLLGARFHMHTRFPKLQIFCLSPLGTAASGIFADFAGGGLLAFRCTFSRDGRTVLCMVPITAVFAGSLSGCFFDA